MILRGKNLDFVILLDVYGDVLTLRQKDFLELYYCNDLSLSEIAEDEGVTRQAVRDSIKRGEQILADLESKLLLAEKIKGCRDIFNKIEELALSADIPEIAGLAARGKELL